MTPLKLIELKSITMHFSELKQLMKTPLELLLVFLGFGVDVSEDVDVREVDPEPAEQRGHPDGDAQAIMNKRCVESKKKCRLVFRSVERKNYFCSSFVLYILFIA